MFTRDFFQPKYKHSINQGLYIDSFTRLKANKLYNSIDFDVYLPTYDCNLQRGLVWTDLQKEQFILSLLRGASTLKFVVVEQVYKTHRTLKVIDGKQRITTIFSYMNNEFPVNYNGTLIYFKDLDRYAQKDITDPNGTRWDVHYSYYDDPISDDVLIQLFEQVNFLGTPQDVDHLENIKKNKSK